MGGFSLIKKPLASPWNELPKRGLWLLRCSQWVFPEGVLPLSPEVLLQAPQSALVVDQGVTPGRLTAGELAAGADRMRKETTEPAFKQMFSCRITKEQREQVVRKAAEMTWRRAWFLSSI